MDIENRCVIDDVHNELMHRRALKQICGTAPRYYSTARYEQIMLTMFLFS